MAVERALFSEYLERSVRLEKGEREGGVKVRMLLKKGKEELLNHARIMHLLFMYFCPNFEVMGCSSMNCH